MTKAVVLLSGGLDSSTTLALAREDGHELYALSIGYGQRHARELVAARALAAHFGCREHRELALDPRGFAGSALTDAGAALPVDRGVDELGAGVPPTYVPARNTLFLAHALAWAEVLGARDLFIGANAIDYSGYPDCRPEFLEAFERMANLGTRAGVEGRTFRIHAPLLRSSKADIVRRAERLGLDFALTSSCYAPGPTGEPCRACDSCLLRQKGFAEAGIRDPLGEGL